MRLTVLETGRCLKIAWGEWMSPKDAEQGALKYAWIPVPFGILDLKLRAGEWIVIEEADLPENLVKDAERAFRLADKTARPWAYL